MSDNHFITSSVSKEMETTLRRFRQSAKVRAAFLIDRNGQLMGQTGDTSSMDTTAMAALTASNIAASRAIAELLGEAEFSGVFHEGTENHVYICLVGTTALLVVVFDTQTSLGLVRLRVKKTVRELADLLGGGTPVSMEEPALSPFAEITEEDIDQLFR